MDAFLRDLRHSVRMFLRSPGFTITAVAALALGIGATTAIFSVVNTVLLRPFVYDSDRLVMLMTKGEGAPEAFVSAALFQYWRTQKESIRDVSAMMQGVLNYTGRDVVEQLHSMQASADVFRCFGVTALLGRTFTPEEDLPGGPRVTVIGENYWNRRFNRDPHILGKSISLSGASYAIIGVVSESPALRQLANAPEVYVPFQIDPATADQGAYLYVAARLAPAVTLDQAQARIVASASGYREKFPTGLGPKESFILKPYREVMVGDSRGPLLVLLGSVSLVLLIACSNVANLLLVRAAARKREIAIRTAIGAGRARIFRQLVSESVLLSLTGGALGLAFGHAGIRALLAINAADLPFVGEKGVEVAMDWHVVGFAIAISLLTGVIFGSIPALQGSRVELNSALKSSGGGTSTSWRRNKVRAALVVSELSLAVVLLVGSALLIRTFVELYRAHRGFQTQSILTMKMSMTSAKYAKTAATAVAVRDGLKRIRATPGVLSATATCCVPLHGTFDLGFQIVSRPSTKGGAQWIPVSPGFFETFHIPVKQGRSFTERDSQPSAPVAIINERMAQMYWQNSNPLRDQIVIPAGGMKELAGEPPRQIIGIVGDVRNESLNTEPKPTMYVPQAQNTDAMNELVLRIAPMVWAARTQVNPLAMASAIKEQLRQATGLPVTDIRSMEEIVSLSTARQRLNTLLMTIFGSAALLLAAIGVYGVMSYFVAQRTKEIGIRIALGAAAADVRNMVVRQGMSVILAGLVVGVAGALALARFLESLLFRVRTRDPFTMIAVPIILSAVAWLALWLPARRASRLNPVDSLRCE